MKSLMDSYKVIIAGGRSFADYELLTTKCDALLKQKSTTLDIVIISGAAKGADSLGERYALERGYAVEHFPADWKKYGRAAGKMRNAQMADIANALIAFWDGKSSGTKNMIDTAMKKKINVSVIRY